MRSKNNVFRINMIFHKPAFTSVIESNTIKKLETFDPKKNSKSGFMHK